MEMPTAVEARRHASGQRRISMGNPEYTESGMQDLEENHYQWKRIDGVGEKVRGLWRLFLAKIVTVKNS